MKTLKIKRQWMGAWHRQIGRRLLITSLWVFGAWAVPAADLTNSVPAATAGTNASLSQLSALSLEQLMDIKVSILGPSESVSQTPAAVSVVTQDDIRRSGARNIPEALRLVPGMDVAQVDASEWAVSARGFNDVFADKLLVSQDGRSIYTPLFSGVFWDVQGTMMEDIDHIEVVRGPGATVWGANAVNGVINIITKSAKDTQGLLVTSGGGNQDPGFAGARYGGAITSNAFYRVYGTFDNHASTVLPDGSDAHNSWQLARGGYRIDWDAANQNLLTFQGDGYMGWINQVFGAYDPANPPTLTDVVQNEMRAAGANALGRWTHTVSDTASYKLQAYYDYTERDAVILNEQRHTFDLNFQDEFALGDRNHLTWGLDYRLTSDTEQNNPTISFNPVAETLNWYSVFAQDEITLVRDRLTLTLGSKFEHNDYTGWEIQPGARLLWTPMEHQTFWASVSRAVRTPSRAEESIILTQARFINPPGVYAPITIAGTNDFESEDLIAYEAGYRTQPFEQLSLDLAGFYNDYSRLRSQQENPSDPTQFYLANGLYGHTYGVEATATWRMTEGWRLQPNYSLLQMDLHARPNGASPADNASVAQIEGSSPQQQFSIRSSLDLPHGVTFDTDLRYVDALPYYHIGGYFELDARLGWRISKNLEVALVGQNLLHDQHAEFGPSYINTQNGGLTEIPRSIYGQITWRF